MALSEAEELELLELEEAEYQAKKSQLAPPRADTKKPSITSSVGRGSVQGFSGGFQDEISGALDAATKDSPFENLPGLAKLGLVPSSAPMWVANKIKELTTTDKSFGDIAADYQQGRDQERLKNREAREANPNAYAVSEFAGNLASPVNKVAPGASLAKSGMIIGGVGAAGQSEADSPMDFLGDTALGAATGGLFGKGVDKFAPHANKGIDFISTKMQPLKERAGKAAQDLSEKAYYAMSRPSLRDVRTQDSNKIGAFIRDEIKPSIGESAESIAGKAEAVNQRAGEALDDVYSRASDKFKSAIDKVGFDPKRDKEMILKAAREELGPAMGASAAVKQLADYLDEISAQHGDLPAEAAKGAYNKAVGEYLPRFRQFIKDRLQFKKSVGSAGDDATQPVLSGMMDDLQRSSPTARPIELRGAAPDQMRPSQAILSEDTFLSPLPQRQGDLFNPLGGDDLLPLNQKMAMDTMSKGEISSLSKQSEIEGLDLVPRRYAEPEMPSIPQQRGQTAMVIEPSAPARPVNPGDIRNPMSPRAANQVKGALDEKINYARDPLKREPILERALSAARTAMSKQVDDGINSLGGDEMLGQLKAANSSWGASKSVMNNAKDRVNRETANKFPFGLTDTITGGAALTYGAVNDDPTGALAIMSGKKLIEKYGAGAVAKSMEKVSQHLLRSPKMADLARTSPRAFQAAVISLTSRLSEGGAFLRAADNDDAGSPTARAIPDEEARQQFLDGN